MLHQTELARELLNDFLIKWDDNAIQKMTLKQYVSIGDKETFCQWVETKTKPLGNINGYPSSKFGIYKRDLEKKPSDRHDYDAEYSWSKSFGGTRKSAFKKVKNEIQEVIQYARVGDFSKIDDLNLNTLFLWKVAYLYSNERLIPIFTRSVLEKCARHYKMKVTRKTKISKMHEYLVNHRPVHLSIYEFGDMLYKKYSGKISPAHPKKGNKRRRGTDSKSTKEQFRRGTTGCVASQDHNKIQNKLQSILENKYKKSQVYVEQNYVDLKVKFVNKEYFYEVKSAQNASDCIKQALGQILSYAFYDTQVINNKKQKLLFIVGKNLPNENDKKFIKYIKQQINPNFDYIAVDINEK